MAEATTEATSKKIPLVGVRFDAQPPARLVHLDTTIEAGCEGALPADVAEELAANPHVPVTLLDHIPEPEKED